jgi:hypothetical protein
MAPEPAKSPNVVSLWASESVPAKNEFGGGECGHSRLGDSASSGVEGPTTDTPSGAMLNARSPFDPCSGRDPQRRFPLRDDR